MKSKVVIYKSVYFVELVKLLLQNLSTINPFAKYISDLHKNYSFKITSHILLPVNEFFWVPGQPKSILLSEMTCLKTKIDAWTT